MALALTSRLLRPLLFGRAWRPLFDKELRVASRRARGYALRCAYVLLLMMFVAIVWIPAVDLRGAGAMSRSQMAEAAKTITLGIVWFQFFGAQLVAIVMLSTAISDEVYGRTLCVLMTTPLSSRQVVLNKLLSRLLQILLLVATSLPLLAIVRVLGGIPWSYLILSLCVTAATVIFVGSVSMLFSSLCRRAYLVVIASLLSVAALFAIFPFVAMILLHDLIRETETLTMLSHVNPVLLLWRFTDSTMAPRPHVSVSASQIVSCCAFLLAAAVGMLLCSVRLVRSVALRRAMGEQVLLGRLRHKHFEDDAVARNPTSSRRDIRRVVGPPMIWKELTCTLSRRERCATGVVLGIECLLIVTCYTFPAVMGIMGYEGAHVAYLWVLLGLAVFFAVTAAATVIGSERESRAWPVLLMTPLTDGDILLGKFMGVLRRCGLIWLSLLAYVAAFVSVEFFRPLAIVHTMIIIASALPFVCGTGFYFGSRCRRTAEAVTANLVLVGVLWCILPLIVQAATFAVGTDWAAGRYFILLTGPFGQAFAMMLTTLEMSVETRRWWWFGFRLDATGMAMLMLVSMVAYVLVSLGFTWRAVRGFRRKIF